MNDKYGKKKAQNKQTHAHSRNMLLQRISQSLANAYVNYLQNRRDRIAMNQLLQLNDHILKDMGLTRSDILEVRRHGYRKGAKGSRSRQLKMKKRSRREQALTEVMMHRYSSNVESTAWRNTQTRTAVLEF